MSFSLLFRMGGGRCRFYPDCSSYGLEAIQKHGAFKGAWLTMTRVAKCGPFHPGGVDLVPEVKNVKEELKGKDNKHFCHHCDVMLKRESK